MPDAAAPDVPHTQGAPKFSPLAKHTELRHAPSSSTVTCPIICEDGILRRHGSPVILPRRRRNVAQKQAENGLPVHGKSPAWPT